MFSSGPTISSTGSLIYSLNPNANGSATLTFNLSDDAGTSTSIATDGSTATGVDTTATQTFTIHVSAVNDRPTFTQGPDITVLEDAPGEQTHSNWATAIHVGPPDEAGQDATRTFEVSVDHPEYFSVQPALDPTGNLTFTLAPNANGIATVSIVLNDHGGTTNGGIEKSTPRTLTITIVEVNDAPTFVAGAQPTVLEDSGATTISNWATVSAGPPSENQVITSILLSNSNPSLFSVAPAVDGNGTLTFTVAHNQNGSATFTMVLKDDGGTANDGVDTSLPQTFTIVVTAVNDAPSFTKGADQTVLEDALAQSLSGWATNILPYPSPDTPLAVDEAGQSMSFELTNDNNALFSVQPAVAADGTLTYSVSPNAYGTATVAVRLRDGGSTVNGGVDLSPPQTFTITITPVNDRPIVAASNPPAVLEDAGAQTVANFATFSPGPNETTQTLVAFTVTNISNPALFAVLPAIDDAGKLTYTLNPDANGTITFDVIAQDDGGTANGGLDMSLPRTLTLIVTPVNDRPTFTAFDPAAVLEDAGATTLTGWATLVPGPTNESTQLALAYTVTSVSNLSLFSGTPRVAVDGTLTFTPAANRFGTSTFTVTVQDDGGTANGGRDTSLSQTFTINVLPVNDRPTFSITAPPSVLEDAPVQTLPSFASFISDPTEPAQGVFAYHVQNISNPGFFAVAPALNVNGTLTYTLAANANGTVTFEVTVQDDGGTANGGIDTSLPKTVTLNVTPVNDIPSIAATPPTVNEDAGAVVISNWAVLVPGPTNESAQSVFAYTLTNVGNHELFAVQPQIDADGTLSFTTAPNRFGIATIQLFVKDFPSRCSSLAAGFTGLTAHCDGLCVKIWTVSIPRAAAASTAL